MDGNKKRTPVRRAAALSYNPENDAVPILSAFGEGYLAEKIIKAAEDAGVPVLPDPGLTSMLAQMSVGDDIPPSLYEVVAKLLIFVSELDQNYGKRMKSVVERDKR